MKLRKVISGGQTGADQAGLFAARDLGLETGGTAPKGYRTEAGNEAELLKSFGLTESKAYDYAARTRQNVLDAQATVWFGNVGSPGYWCTEKASREYGKYNHFYVNPTAEQMRDLADLYEIINVAGNRYSKNPKVVGIVREAFSKLEKRNEAA